jgi:DNA polymerase-3 subunit epsilon
MTMAKDYLYMLVEKNKLCPKYTGLERTKGACYLGDICHLCSEKETIKSYNLRVLNSAQKKEMNQWIVGPGRSIDEKGVVKIQKGIYAGFGYVNTEINITEEEMDACIIAYKTNTDTRRILEGFLNNPIPKAYQLIKTKN